MHTQLSIRVINHNNEDVITISNLLHIFFVWMKFRREDFKVQNILLYNIYNSIVSTQNLFSKKMIYGLDLSRTILMC